MKKFVVIKCPKCGYEYLPAELFYPDEVIGKPYNIIRDDFGKIEYFEDDIISQTIEYTCDNCGCVFDVSVDMTFKCVENKEHNFEEEHTSKIYSDNRITLEENND